MRAGRAVQARTGSDHPERMRFDMAKAASTTPFRQSVEAAVAAAHAGGDSFHDILADLSTVLGCMVAAGSKDRRTRLSFVKASMTVVEAVINKDLN